MTLDETHDAELRSWVPGADAGTDFPVQNLPLGVFSRRGDGRHRIGVAIGDFVFDAPAAVDAGLLRHDGDLLQEPTLNRLMAGGTEARRALRRSISTLLRQGSAAAASAAAVLVPIREAELHLPCQIGDYTDFFASIQHATNAGSMLRPDNPLLPNYKWVPVGYHGRASTVVVSGTPVRRPEGQQRGPGAPAPVFGPSRQLDYEAELGAFIGPGNRMGEKVRISEAGDQLFGLCLLNDWSARDIQGWEYQPLGPFLAKSFATSLSPWVVTQEALAPFRCARPARPAGDPGPLPYLDDPSDAATGAFGITIEVHLLTPAMRKAGVPPVRLSRADAANGLYWTMGQMVAHHTSNGCGLRPGDLIGSGTVSGDTPDSRGSLLELTRRGSEPLGLPGGEQRGFLQDGDTVIMTARCERPGFASIGFGSCEGTVVAAAS